jgi:hypothetical protein
MCRDVFNWAAANPTGYETLRRLSTMSGMSSNEMRRQSVATGLFDRESDFDTFISTSLSSIDNPTAAKDGSGRRMSQHGSNFSNMLKKMRSVSQSSAGDSEQHNPFGNYALSSSPSASAATPRFTVPWGESGTIAEGDEEDEVDLGPMLSPSTSRTLPTRSK